MVCIHGFDWITYVERVMPAFARWLIDEDESSTYQLYERTRCAEGEQFVPPAVQHLCTWPRAQTFVRQLPRGPQALREYQKLCSPEQFTALSDLYVHQFPPQLYQNSDALRFVWGAIVEQYCLPWFHHPQNDAMDTDVSVEAANELQTTHNELLTLLREAGLKELAQAISEQSSLEGTDDLSVFERSQEQGSPPDGKIDRTDSMNQVGIGGADEEGAPRGIEIGRRPTTLHMRGWLATLSVRAMALFELLACGRRCMPFGHQSGEPFGAYIGYLTPTEVKELALCLRHAQIPDQLVAERDYLLFRRQRMDETAPFRMIDEVLPAYANPFLRAVRKAAQQEIGLICSED